MATAFGVYFFLVFCCLAAALPAFYPLRKWLMLLCVLVLIGYVGFREVGVGADDRNYISYFEQIPSLWYFNLDFLNNSQIDLGLAFLGIIAKSIYDSPTTFFIVCATFSITLDLVFYYRYGGNFCFMATMIFMVHTMLYRDMNQIASSQSVALLLYCFPLLYRKKYLATLGLIALATLFHKQSLAFLIVLAFPLINWTTNKYLLIILLAYVVYFLKLPGILIQYTPNVAGIRDSVLMYANSFYADSVRLFDVTNIKNIFFCLLLAIYLKPIKQSHPLMELMATSYLFCAAWRVAFADWGILAARVATLFGVTEVLVLPYLFYVITRNWVLTFLGSFGFSFLMLYMNLSKGVSVPYGLSFPFL